jgi:hypothetical protein
MSDINRRKFMSTLGSTALALKTGLSSVSAEGRPAHAAAAGQETGMPAASVSLPSKPTIGIQIGAVSFLDEGTEKVLDILQEKGGVNTLFIASFTYGNGTAGRMIPGHPFPDHGVQGYTYEFHGGNYATPHLQYYKDTILKEMKAPDHGNVDILEKVIPIAKKRGFKVFTWSEDVWSPSKTPHYEAICEKDLYGRPAGTVCLNNPDVRAFWRDLHEDFTRSYDIDGVMWGSERYGAFGNAIESVHNPNGNDPSRVTCFCTFCQQKAKSRGIDVTRAFEGFHALETWVRACRGGQRPTDGYYVTLWRLMFRYPELLAWETLFNDSVHETYADIYKTVKTAKPDAGVGWHVWHAASFSPLFRAQTDLGELSKYSDYLKVTVYNNLGGERMHTYVSSLRNTLMGDLPIDESLEFEYRVMNLRERGYDELPYTGLSADYVYRETKRTVDDVNGTKTEIWPGLDVDISNLDINYSHCSPPVIRECTKAAFRGGAKGLVISRKYSEMNLVNLAAVGDALREMKIVS